MKTPRYDFSLSVIVPVFNDEEVLEELHRRLRAVVETLCADYEIIFVDDGSSDSSFHILQELRARNNSITIVKFTRNFGQSNAIAAGIDLASNDITVIMDSDLQDPPEDIPRLIDALLKENTAMAITRWITRRDKAFKIYASRFFHVVTNRFTDLYHLPGLGVFRAMRRDVVEALKRIPEKTSTSISLLYWMGFDYTVVDLHRDERHAGTSGYTLSKMVRLFFDRIFSHSLVPIRMASLIGVFLGLSSIVLAIYYLCRKFIYENIVPGWTSLVVLILFLFGINFIFLGVIGEYLGRIFLETKQRPKYIVAEVYKKGTTVDG